MKISREIVTFLLMAWFLLALSEVICSRQGYQDAATVAGVADRWLAHWTVKILCALTLAWNIIPTGGGGK